MEILNILIIVFLLFLSAVFAGLMLGLMSLNVFELRRKAKLGNPDALKVYPLRKKGHLILSTLIIGNVGVNAVLSIFLGHLTNGILAAILATALIVIFGEIVPQAIFVKYALKFTAKASWLVKILVILFYPVTKPIVVMLDKFLGNEFQPIYTKKELLLFLDEHRTSKKLDDSEYEILKGGLIFSDKTVKDIMTKWENVFSLSDTTVLTKDVLVNLQKEAYTRMPVCKEGKEGKKRVRGILFSKDLINISPENNILVKSIMRREVVFVRESAKLDDILNLFKQERNHLFVVLGSNKQVVGIVTLEDVLEEIVGEIVDEYDTASIKY
jgi:metal transporter CNNM